MTIEKAILILDLLLVSEARRGTVDQHNAIALGIEALKAVANWNKYQIPQHQFHLPGETES